MEYEYVLSIVFITMNRKFQLKDAIQSCINSDIPESHEFVVIDNGSTDGSENYIKTQFPLINMKYYMQESNLGIGGGRNLGISLAKGKYLYILDDDAIINPNCQSNFFLSSIQKFETSNTIGGITTRVYDEALGKYRNSTEAKSFTMEAPLVLMLHGNTHFLRNGIPGVEYCPSIRYGFEDLYASIRIFDAGYKIFLNPETETIHKPTLNKWAMNSPYRNEIIVKEIAGKLTVKALLFPSYLFPFMVIATIFRIQKSLGMSMINIRSVFSLYTLQTRGVTVKKTSLKTVQFLLKEFGLSAIF